MGKLCSIVINHYNEDLITFRELMDTLMIQKSYNAKEFEFILVNDGGPNSVKLSKENIDNYWLLNIKNIMLDENKGISHCRNVGIEEATGEYITFIDCDDLVYSPMYLTQFSTYYNDSDMIEFKALSIDKEGNMSNDVPSSYLGGKFFRKDLLEKYKIRFNDNLGIFEDIEFIERYNSIIMNKQVIDEIGMIYRQRDGSISDKFNKEYSEEKEASLKIVCDKAILKFYKDNGLERSIIKYINQILALLVISKKGNKKFYNKYKEIEPYLSEYKCYINKEYGSSINIVRMRKGILEYITSDIYNTDIVDMKYILSIF